MVRTLRSVATPGVKVLHRRNCADVLSSNAFHRWEKIAPEPPQPRHQPTPAALLDLEAGPGQPLYFSKRDATSYFDSLAAPLEMRKWFGRPGVKALDLVHALGSSSLEDLREFIDWDGDGRGIDRGYLGVGSRGHSTGVNSIKHEAAVAVGDHGLANFNIAWPVYIRYETSRFPWYVCALIPVIASGKKCPVCRTTDLIYPVIFRHLRDFHSLVAVFAHVHEALPNPIYMLFDGDHHIG